MKSTYRVKGVYEEGDKVKLVLDGSIIKEGNLNPLEAMQNIAQFQEKMTYSTKQIQDPDQIRISKEEYDKHKWILGDIITIEIEGGEK